MSQTRLPNSIFLALAMLGVAQYFYYAPRLPEVIGSHFGASGAVNGWQPKSSFFLVELGILALAVVITFVVPKVIEAMPISMINLPNKEFWLGADKREETLMFLRAWSRWFGCGLLAFLLYVMELAFRANLQAPPHFNNAAFVPGLVGFVLVDFGLLGRMVLHFSRAGE